MNASSLAGPPRIRIAILSRQFVQTGGGAERYAISLVEELSDRCEIHVFAQHIGHSWPGVSYHPIPTLCKRPRWINQLWFAAVTWWKTRRGFDVVHSHEMTWHGQVQTVHVRPVKVSLFAGKRGPSRLAACLKVATSPRLLVYLLLERFRLEGRGRKAIVATSRGLSEEIQGAYPETGDCIRLVTPGIKQIMGVTDAEKRRNARTALHLPLDAHCLLFIANDYRKKGLPALLQALARLEAAVHLVVVGNPVHIPEFRDMAEQMGVQGRVHFLGHRSDMDICFCAADGLVHPTLEDTYAMVVLEAMSHALPVVVSSATYCGISADLTDGENALLIANPQDSEALARQIDQVLTNSALRQQLGVAALQFAASRLWSEKADLQWRIYQEVGAL